jgi:hypothetical protein
VKIGLGARAHAAGLQWTTYMGVPEEHMENVDEIIANEQFLVARSSDGRATCRV